MTVKGIDVSAYQGTTFSTSGLGFAIIKATEGRSYINPKQEEQAAHARAAGLLVGFYHFLWPGNIKEQAAYFVEKCASVEGDILACDWERTGDGTAATNAEKDAFIREVQRLRGSTHKTLLYCNRDFWINRDETSFAGDGLWIADYVTAGQPRIQADWVIHQYTDSPVDTNVADFADKAAMKKWATGAAATSTADRTETQPAKESKPKPAPPFPGRDKFGPGKSNASILALGKQLVKKGFGGHYKVGPSKSWGDADRQCVRAFQLAHKELAGDADGLPGPLTWKLLFS